MYNPVTIVKNSKLFYLLFFVLVLVNVVPLSLSNYYMYNTSKQYQTNQLVNNKDNLFESISIALTEFVFKGEVENIDNMVKNLIQDASIRSIQIDDKNMGLIVNKNLNRLCEHKESLYSYRQDLYFKEEPYKNQYLGSLLIKYGNCQIVREIKTQERTIYTINIVQILLSLLLLLLLIKYKLLKPIQRLLDNLTDIGNKQLEKKFVWNQQDEIGQIGRGIEQTRLSLKKLLTEEKSQKEIQKLEEQLYHQSKVASLGELIAIIAHQWRQPLNAINGATVHVRQSLSSSFDKRDIEETMKRIEDNIYLLNDTIENFMSFYQDKNDIFQDFSVKEAIESCSKILSPDSHFSYTLNISCQQDIMVTGDKSLFKQLILIILTNALQQFEKKSTFFPRLSEMTKQEQSAFLKEIEKKTPRVDITVSNYTANIAKIEIADNGGGIEETMLESIFEAHISTKDNNSNNGLGLYIAKKIINQRKDTVHEATIYAKNNPNGATFTIIY